MFRSFDRVTKSHFDIKLQVIFSVSLDEFPAGVKHRISLCASVTLIRKLTYDLADLVVLVQ